MPVSKKTKDDKTKSRYDRYRFARAALRQVIRQARHKTVDLDNTSVEIGVYDADDHRLMSTVSTNLRDLSLLANHSCEIDAMTRAVQRIGSRVVTKDWAPRPGITLRAAIVDLTVAVEDKTLDKLRAAEDVICRDVLRRFQIHPRGWSGIRAVREDLVSELYRLLEQRLETQEKTVEQNTLGAVLHGLGLPVESGLTAAHVVKLINDTHYRKDESITVTGGHNPFIGPISFGGRQGGKNTIAAGARAGIADVLARLGIPAHPDDLTLSAAKGAQLVNEKIEKQAANMAEAIRRSERAVLLDELQVAPAKSAVSANTRDATVAAIRDVIGPPTELIAQRTMTVAAARLGIYPNRRSNAASIQQSIVDFHRERLEMARLEGATTVARDILPIMPKTVDEIAVAVRRKLHQSALEVAHNIAVELYGDDGQDVKDGGDLIALVRRRSPSGAPLNRAADLVEVAERRRLLVAANYGNPVDEQWPRTPSRAVAGLRQIIRHQTLQQLHNHLFGPQGENEQESLSTDINVEQYTHYLQEMAAKNPSPAAVSHTLRLLDQVLFDRVLSWPGAQDDQVPEDVTVAQFADRVATLVEQHDALSESAAKLLTGSAAVRERYIQLRSRYSAEHDRTHHTQGDFTDSAIALLMSGRDRLHVSMGHKRAARAEVWAVHQRRDLWRLGSLADNLGHITDNVDDKKRLVEAAALLLCAAEAFTP